MKLSRILPLVVGGAVAGMVVSAASPAQAIVWTNPNTSITYDITTFTGSYNANTSLITSQPWWGDATASANAATTIGTGLGLGATYFGFPAGPLFAYATNSSVTLIGGYQIVPNFGGLIDTGTASGGSSVANTSVVYAVATATPVPFDIPPGASIGSIFILGLMRQAKKHLAAKKPVVNPVETV